MEIHATENDNTVKACKLLTAQRQKKEAIWKRFMAWLRAHNSNNFFMCLSIFWLLLGALSVIGNFLSPDDRWLLAGLLYVVMASIFAVGGYLGHVLFHILNWNRSISQEQHRIILLQEKLTSVLERIVALQERKG